MQNRNRDVGAVFLQPYIGGYLRPKLFLDVPWSLAFSDPVRKGDA